MHPQSTLPAGLDAATATCTICGRTLPLSAFHRDRSTKDGHSRRCKACACANARARYRDKKAGIPPPATNRRGHNLKGAKPWLRGATNVRWKGDEANGNTKRARARRIYHDVGACERCGGPATHRHHRDADPGNNDAANIAFVCPRCHMVVDGRLDAARARCNAIRRKPRQAQPCANCGRLAKLDPAGRCHACYEYWRRHGVDIAPTSMRRSRKASLQGKDES